MLDVNTGLSLDYFKTNLSDFDKSLVVAPTFIKPRFTKKRDKFFLQKRLYISYSYFSFFLLEKTKNGKFIGKMEMEASDLNFIVDSDTIFHKIYKDSRNLNYTLEIIKQQ